MSWRENPDNNPMTVSQGDNIIRLLVDILDRLTVSPGRLTPEDYKNIDVAKKALES